MEPTSQWLCCKMQKMNGQLKQANDQNKFLVIKDEVGTAATFFDYSGTLVELDKLKIQMTLGTKSKEQVLDLLRTKLLAAMRFGKTLCLSLGKISIDFKSDLNDAKHFPADTVFDLPSWKDNDAEHWRALIHSESDDVDYMALNKGTFACKPEFNIVVLTQMDNDAEIAELLAGIPHAEEGIKLVVN